jgi:hypothetical protein
MTHPALSFRWLSYVFCLLSSLPLAAQPSSSKKTAAEFGGFLLEPTIWETKLVDLEKKFTIQRTKEQMEMLAFQRQIMKKNGFDPGEPNNSVFVWLSAQHDSLRANGGDLSLWGEDIGEVVIRGNEGNVSGLNLSLYNRGDDRQIRASELTVMFTKWKTLLDEKIGVKGEARKSSAAVQVTALQWRKGNTAFLLEGSIAKVEGIERAEFLRIRVASLADAAGSKIAGRSTLRSNVETKDGGDVFIKNMPMVDQGQKGYCAVASIARVTSYYGLDVDQHEMAQIANTSVFGTDPEEMEEAFKKIVGKLHIRTTQHYEFTERQFDADVRAYNLLAKKEGKEQFKAPKDHILIPGAVWMLMDPDIFARVKGEQSGCKRFMTKVAEYIDQGIPLCWCLRLGMFPEKGIPQSGGGHMRLIIGYNEKTQEIIYTDSWGKGHEFKRMPLSHAYASSMCVYTMSPTR